MQSYLRKVIDETIVGVPCPVHKLQKIRKGVPESIITKEWDSVIFGLFLEKGDTAYARDGYHDAIKLIEKHLLEK